MAYDETLAARIRVAMADRPGVTERKMFGGIAFMLDDHMAVGVVGGELMARVGPDALARALAMPDARPMDFTGRPMRGYVFVGSAGVADDSALRGWIEMAADFVRALPPKKR